MTNWLRELFWVKSLKSFLFRISHKNILPRLKISVLLFFYSSFWSSLQFVEVLLEKHTPYSINISLIITSLLLLSRLVIRCLYIWESFSWLFNITLLFTTYVAIMGPFQSHWIPEHNPSLLVRLTFFTSRFMSFHSIHDQNHTKSLPNDAVSLT